MFKAEQVQDPDFTFDIEDYYFDLYLSTDY